MASFYVGFMVDQTDPISFPSLPYGISASVIRPGRMLNFAKGANSIVSDFLIMATIHLLIKGKVQGVFYRALTKKRADELGVRGWVSNSADGHVEVMATGSLESLDQLVAFCRKGPPNAKVTDLQISAKEEVPFNGFVIRH